MDYLLLVVIFVGGFALGAGACFYLAVQVFATQLDREEELREEIAFLRHALKKRSTPQKHPTPAAQPPALTQKEVRTLLFLVHPDRNSRPEATEATKAPTRLLERT